MVCLRCDSNLDMCGFGRGLWCEFEISRLLVSIYKFVFVCICVLTFIISEDNSHVLCLC